MMQDGVYMNLGEPLNSLQYVEYGGTSQKWQGPPDSLAVVGPAHSTRSLGKPSTWGRGWQRHTGFSTCFPDTRRSA